LAKKPSYEELEQRLKELEKESVDRKQEEEKSEKHLESLLHYSSLAIVILDDKHRIISCNRYFENLFQLKEPEILGKNLDQVIAQKEYIKDAMSYTKKTFRGEAINGSGKRYRKDGALIDVEFIGVPVVIEGKVVGAYGIYLDATERKKAEEVLKSEKDKLQALMDGLARAEIGIDIVGIDHKILFQNKILKERFGDLAGELCYEKYMGLEKPCDFCPMVESVKNNKVESTELIGIDGKNYVLFSAPIPNPDGTIHSAIEVVLDITERKRAEEALRESERKLTIRNKITEIFLIIPENEIYGEVLKVILENMASKYGVFGYIGEDGAFVCQSITRDIWDQCQISDKDIVFPRETWGGIWGKALIEKKTFYSNESFSVPQGHIPILRALDVPIIHQGEVIGNLLVGNKPTDYDEKDQELLETIANYIAPILHARLQRDQQEATRKQKEEALKESEEKYRLLVENATDAIFIAQDGVIKFPNPKTEEVIGYTQEELAKIPFVDLIHTEDRDIVFERHKRRLKGEEPPSTCSFRIISKAGEELWAQLNTVLITWEGRAATLNFLRDVTEQRRLESQLQHAQRMEAIGTLAGGIAHNFNNVLMGIQGYASLILLGKTSDHPDYERLNNIEQGVLNGAELTNQLLGFARGEKYEIKPTDLNELIKSQNRMFERTKKEINIRGKYQDNPWTVEVDQGQINQVILNFYVNAWQSMPKGGDFYIQTENVTLDEDYTRPFNVTPGRYVKISITDTGVGMDEETQKRIFEPFFTTQEMGRGTGLGLASAYGIIKNHGGIINVYSEKGEGTTFNIYLPASEKKLIKEKELPEELLKGTETVLLVDDEDMVIEIGEELLQSLGYKVVIARGGKEAIELYKNRQGTIDIIILDMIMPGVGGGETYDRMKDINPDIKVLLSSGYSIDGQAAEILKRGCDGFVQKPFTMREVSQRIREILDKD
jgi:two-component system cell cycle sensor histidine kinase/response regulator CckA